MLKVPYRKLRPNSKGGLNNKHNKCNYQRKLQYVGKRIVQGIPVLSIFALVGMISCSVILPHQIANEHKAYAIETDSSDSGIMPLADTSASLTIDDGKIKDTIFATNGEFAYATHKVSINATNIKSYTLTLAKTAGLTGPSTVNDAGTGVTPANMDNQWGYAWINENDDPTTATYKTLSTANNLADIAIDSNHNVNASKQLVFGAKFGSSAASGTYHAEATLSLVATPYTVVNYSISYNLNGGTSSAIAATTASDDTGAASKTLQVTSTVPTRSGYKFLGWATSSTGSVAYASGANITLQATNPTITLYAVWQQELTIKGITQMQQMTSGICNASTIGDTATLTDTRDNSTYTIRKHEDGKCWMTQNLRLINKTITSANSDVTSNFTVPASNETNFTDSNYNVRAAYLDAAYGGYYNWYTATAGTGTQTLTSGDASSSICPKNWKLSKEADYTNLFSVLGVSDNSTGSNLLRNSLYGFQFAGQVNDKEYKGSENYGYYWTSTASSSTAYTMLITASVARITTHNNKTYGFPVRCIVYPN